VVGEGVEPVVGAGVVVGALGVDPPPVQPAINPPKRNAAMAAPFACRSVKVMNLLPSVEP